MRLIKFTQANSKSTSIFLNPEMVVAAFPDERSVGIIVAAQLNGGESITYHVKEDIETVCKALSF